MASAIHPDLRAYLNRNSGNLADWWLVKLDDGTAIFPETAGDTPTDPNSIIVVDMNERALKLTVVADPGPPPNTDNL